MRRRSKRAALLAYLAIALPHGFHRRDKLLALFWPDLDGAHARAALSQALHVLRATLGDEAIVARGDEEIALVDAGLWCDARAFEAALEAGRPSDALALYRGDLLDGFFLTGAPEFERWLDVERARLRQRAADAAWAAAEEQACHRNALEAERLAMRAASLSPADEAVARRLMSFLNHLGDRAAAMRAYEAFVRELATQYELEPSAETQALAAAIRAERQPPPAPGAPAAVVAPQSDAEPPGGDTAAAPDAASAPRQPRERHRATIHWARGRRWQLLAAFLLLALVAFGAISRASRRRSSGADAPRVAVVPFRNLGAAEDAYLAEGISDEIATRLAMVTGLRVIGTQSMKQNRSAEAAPRQIGRELGVEYVLTGTVTAQRSSSGVRHLRIRPQLVRVRDGSEAWAAVVDQDLEHMSELFLAVSGIAQQVADALHVGLEGPERRGLARVPTGSLEAYDDFLRGREFVTRNWSPSNTLAAIRTLDRAVARDPKFALAHAWLAIAHANAEWVNRLGAEHLDHAKAAAETAIALDPELPDAQIALGHYYYACCADYERAAWHLGQGYAKRPGDAQAAMFIGNVHKRRARWDDAVRYYERAAASDPRWAAPLVNLAQLQLWRRQYGGAARTVERVLAIEPQHAFAHAFKVWLALLPRGDTALARRAVREAVHAADDDGSMRLAFYLALLGRDYPAALSLASAAVPAGGAAGDLDEGLPSDHVRRALARLLSGDSSAARSEFAVASRDLEGRLRRAPPRSLRTETWLRASLALTYAGEGRRHDALAQVERLRATDPVAVDAIDGPVALQNVALAHVLLGDTQGAIAVLRRLLSIPSRLSAELLRLDPLWDALRGDPAFEQLVARPRRS